MSNRSPKILWLIDYSLMTSITHWCNWLLLNDPSITHGLLYYVRKTLLLLSCTTFFCLWFFCLCQMHFSLYLELLLTMLRRKVLITNIVQFAKLNNLDRATVKVWFNNKRQRDRRTFWSLSSMCYLSWKE